MTKGPPPRDIKKRLIGKSYLLSSLQTATTQPASARDSQLLFQQLAAIRAELARKRHELDVLAPGPQLVPNNWMMETIVVSLELAHHTLDL